MKPMMGKASVQWTGGTQDGSGTMTTESGMLKQTRCFLDTMFKKKVHLRFRRNGDGWIKLEMEALPLQSFEENTFEVRVALKPKVGAIRNFNVS